MTYVKLYAALWGCLLMIAGGLALTGNFTNMTAVAYGFISFGMIFMGMMSVLPSLVSTPEGRSALCESASRGSKRERARRDTLPTIVHDWFFPRGIELSPPKHN